MLCWVDFKSYLVTFVLVDLFSLLVSSYLFTVCMRPPTTTTTTVICVSIAVQQWLHHCHCHHISDCRWHWLQSRASLASRVLCMPANGPSSLPAPRSMAAVRGVPLLHRAGPDGHCRYPREKIQGHSLQNGGIDETI